MKDIFGFLTVKKVEIIDKPDSRAHNFNFKWQFNSSDFFQAQSLIIRQEIIGNRYFCEVIVDEAFGLIIFFSVSTVFEFN